MRIGAAIVVMLLATTMAAEEPTRYSTYFENDTHAFSFVRGTDRHYTQGLHFRVFYEEGDVPRLVERMAFCRSKACTTGFSFGQSIYTPTRIIGARPVTFDRPYGGWLYGGFLLQARDPAARVIHDVEADLGIVGPQSYAGDIQTWWHVKVLRIAPAGGWRNQLGNEPGVLLQYSRRKELFEGVTRGGIRYSDLLFRAGGAAGNVFTYVNAGPMFRVGYNISDDFGRLPPSLLSASLDRHSLNAAPATPTVEAYVFAGADGRYVLHNIFLDGNCCRHSLSVRKKHTVGDFEWGAAFRYRMVKLTWRQVRRSREFVGQNRADLYGSYNLTIDRSF